MEICKDLIPYESYPSHGKAILLLFIISGSILIGITTVLSNTVNFSCNPDKNIGADLTQKTFIQTSCLSKYEETYNSPIPLHWYITLNFGLVLFLSLVYALGVKSRIRKYDTPENPNRDIELGLLQQSSPSSETGHVLNTKSCIPVFYIYIAQLVFARIVPTILFAGLIFFPSNFPTEFPCPWSSQGLNIMQDSLGQRNSTTVTVDCKNLVASKNKTLAIVVGIVNIVFALVALLEAMYLVWKVCGNKSYSSDPEFCSVYLLRNRKELHKIEEYKRTRINAIIDLYKKKVKSKVRKKVIPTNIPLITQQGRRDENHRGNTRRDEIYQSYIKDPDPSILINDMEDLFKNTTQPSRRILVIGRPGIGKSTLSKKILSDWTGAKKDDFYYEKIVILLQFRFLNLGKEITLKETLKRSVGVSGLKPREFDGLFEYILENPEKLLVIFDGLDELRVDCDCVDSAEAAPDNHGEPMSIFSLWYKLMSGTLLRGATVITTSRPTADQLYSNLEREVDKTVEILGFTESGIEKYVEEFCRDREVESKTLWGHIKASAALLSLCYVPANISIVCLTLERCESVASLPKTLTELYKRAIAKILWDHNRHEKRRNNERFDDFLESESLFKQLVKPKSVALKGMKNENVIFRRKEVCSAIKDCGLFNQLEDDNASQFCFLHLTFQEFLAAWKLVDDCNGPSDVDTILSNYLQDPNWHMVIQFFAGLVGDKVREGKLSKDCYQCFSERIPSDVKHWTGPLLRDVLLMIKCLHELQDSDIVASTAGEVMCKDELVGLFADTDTSRLAPAECSALSQFLIHIKNLDRLDLSNHHFADSGFREVVKVFENKCNELTKVRLCNNLITDEGVRVLCCVLNNENCKLTSINLSGNEITDEGVQDLCCALKNENCKLTSVHLNSNKITDNCVHELCCALENENCELTSIDLSHTLITDEGVRNLCDALKNENCKLSSVGLSFNGITDNGVQDLCCALKNENCKLTSIELSYNEITDESVHDLCRALKNENCILTSIDLRGNKLTYQDSLYIRSAAVANRNFKLRW